jgi:hypothetical protein
MKRQIALVLSLILAIVAAGFYIHTRNTDVRAPLAFCVIAPALITFFWFVSGSRGSPADTLFDDGVLRKATAGSIVVEYLVLVGTFAFWGEGTAPLPPMTALLIPSFTTIVGVVIAFYFGASAYVAARSRTQGGAIKDGGNDKGSPDQPRAARGALPAARP